MVSQGYGYVVVGCMMVVLRNRYVVVGYMVVGRRYVGLVVGYMSVGYWCIIYGCASRRGRGSFN
jgi:hypothetical protein